MYLSEYLPRLEQISVTVDVPPSTNAVRSLALRDTRILLDTAIKNTSENTPNPDACTTSAAAGTAGTPRTPGGTDAHAWASTTHHEIHLPLQETAKLAGAKITKLACRDDVVALTLSLNAPKVKAEPSPFTALPNTNGVWSVEDLLKKTPRDTRDVSQFQFTCAACGAVIVDSKSFKFVDMPSEYWHELMDFWHCHKPHEDHHNIDINEKNYNGKLNPKPGYVHVGSSYILLPSSTENCARCGFHLGKIDGTALKINKWNLHLTYSGKTEKYPPYSYVYFAMLDRVNSSGVRKFTVKRRGSSSAYNVWVTSVGLDVSYADKTLAECLKLLYAVQSDSRDDDVLEVEAEVFDSLHSYFTENNALLPKGHQKVELMDGDLKRKYDVCYLAPQGNTL
ncbi:hypothetical protein JCM33374_g1430 [Metschnikowia sp. JCM 33374]|nr:hypothetical protein JCM33374_g1430 [Metschnikowia sp. JCM 33374]